MQSVLVLNQNYEPLMTARTVRAVVLIQRGKAESVSLYPCPIRTSSGEIERPSVIRLFAFVKRPRPQVRFTRRNIFARDSYECAYCGKSPRELTVDHVQPVSRGGPDTWTNCVSACKGCNHRKGARTPDEARMSLKRTPFEPRVTNPLHMLGMQPEPEWLAFLPAVE
jgi:5-methylcytosine-specific restriction endonuclease McrA